MKKTAKKQLDTLGRRSKHSTSFLAAEAIAGCIKANEWQMAEMLTGIDDVEAGKVVSHHRVSKWLRSWGTPSEGQAPR